MTVIAGSTKSHCFSHPSNHSWAILKIRDTKNKRFQRLLSLRHFVLCSSWYVIIYYNLIGFNIWLVLCAGYPLNTIQSLYIKTIAT